MANVVYNSFKSAIMEGGIDLDTSGDEIKVALVTSSYTPNIDTHEFYDDVTNEVTGTGYTAGGAVLGSQAVTTNTTDDEGVFDAADVTWSASTITARGAVIYKNTGTASTSPLIAYIDFTEDKVSSSGNFTIQWNAEGILNLT
jgi:hypothetical protein